MAGSITLVVSGDLPPGLIAQETRDLAVTLGRLGVTAEPPAAAAQAGERGILNALGMLAIGQELYEIGEALFEGLKRFLGTDRRVKIEVTWPDGRKISVDANTIDEMKAMLVHAKDTLG